MDEQIVGEGSGPVQVTTFASLVWVDPVLGQEAVNAVTKAVVKAWKRMEGDVGIVIMPMVINDENLQERNVFGVGRLAQHPVDIAVEHYETKRSEVRR